MVFVGCILGPFTVKLVLMPKKIFHGCPSFSLFVGVGTQWRFKKELIDEWIVQKELKDRGKRERF